jgi:guanine deaminase
MGIAKSEFMRAALREARRGALANEGGPFGAVIVKGGKIVSRAHNSVVKINDPTAHAEVLAIRRASSKLKRFNLSDCTIYTSCEPCPMCLAAIHWARIPVVYFGCTRSDAARIGFDDEFFYRALEGRTSKAEKRVRTVQLGRKECLALFRDWSRKPDKILY